MAAICLDCFQSRPGRNGKATFEEHHFVTVRLEVSVTELEMLNAHMSSKCFVS